MSKKYVLVVALATLCLSIPKQEAMAQSTTTHKVSDANVVGHVVDSKTGEHLTGITIAIKGTTYGVTTDVTGHYFLKNLKPGKVTLIMRGMGYVSQEKTITVDGKHVVELNFDAKEDNINLDEVVVSSNRQATLRRVAPTLVNVIGEKTFEHVNASNLAQGIVFQPGVRVENNCQNCGFNQVRINGLDGRYSQILIDSRPIMSALAGVYGMEQIPANMIERVEVVRGGGSALFGSSAIAGVINIITKEPTSNSFSFNESATLTGFKNLDNNVNFNSSIVSADNKMGASIFGQSRSRDAWDKNGDGYSEIGQIAARSVGTHMFLRPTDLSKITAEFHTLSEDRRGGDHLDWPDHVAGVAEHIQHSIYSANLRYDLFSTDYKHHLQAYLSGQQIHRKSYYGGIGEITTTDASGKEITTGQLGYPIPKDKYGDNYGFTRGRTYNLGLQYSYDLEHLWFMPAQLLLGAEYTYDNLRDKMPIRSWEKADGKDYSKFPELDQTIGTWGQLAQIEWKNDAFSILLGTRLDEVSSLKKAIFSPRATLRYNPTKSINLRATYAKGFRAPQVFDEDLHVGIVGGEAKKVFNDANLRPEVSHAFSVSADTYFKLGDAQVNFLAEGFYTRITDVFTEEEDQTKNSAQDGIKYVNRINGAGAKVFGANFEAKLAYNNFSVQGGLTLTSNKFDEAQEWGLITEKVGNDYAKEVDATNNTFTYKNTSMTSREITRTPSVYGYLTLGYEPVEDLNLALTGTYTGSMYIPHTIKIGQEAAVSVRGKGLTADEDSTGELPRADELIKSPTYFDLGAKISYDFHLFRGSKLQLYVGVNNLFNSFQKDFDFGPDRDSAYIYGPTLPQSGYAGIKLTF